MAIRTTVSRAALARAIRAQSATIYLAWGSGDPDWDANIEAYPVTDDMTALTAEIGRRKLSYSCFAVPDEAGELVTPSGQFAPSETPEQYLYLRFTFDLADAAGATIRETGLYLFCEPVEGLPAGQAYFTPAQIADPGMLFAVERFVGFARSPDVTQVFGFVIPL